MLGRNEFLAIGIVDGAGPDVRILLAAPLRPDDVETIFAGRLTELEEVRWDDPSGGVVARIVRKAGSIILSERPLVGESHAVLSAMLDGVRSLGIDALPWTKEARGFVQRSEWTRNHASVDDSWPDCSITGMETTLDVWLAPFLGGIRRKDALTRLNLLAAIQSRFSHAQLRQLDTLAPNYVVVPSGSKVHLSYDSGDHPVLAVKLQELFGLTRTPTVGGGRTPVTLHLLSPAARPLAVTQDLPSFWKNVYPEIRTQMRSRYPRHPWPEDPMSARPTKKTIGRKRR
jgi:ATP-dependent helicase HrpB